MLFPVPMSWGKGLVASTNTPYTEPVSSLFSFLHSATKATNLQSKNAIPLLEDLCWLQSGAWTTDLSLCNQGPQYSDSSHLSSLSQPALVWRLLWPSQRPPCYPTILPLARTTPVAQKALPSSFCNSHHSTRTSSIAPYAVLLLIPFMPPLHSFTQWFMI